MSLYASRYSQPLFDVEAVRNTEGTTVPAVVAAPGAIVLVRRSGEVTAAELYADREMATALANPVPTGVALGTPGVDDYGNLVFWAEAGTDEGGSIAYEAMVTIGAVTVGPFPLGTLPPDAAEPVLRYR